MSHIEADVLQDFILVPLLFLVYINGTPGSLTSVIKLLADDTSLLSVVHDLKTESTMINEDLTKIYQWA